MIPLSHCSTARNAYSTRWNRCGCAVLVAKMPDRKDCISRIRLPIDIKPEDTWEIPYRAVGKDGKTLEWLARGAPDKRLAYVSTLAREADRMSAFRPMRLHQRFRHFLSHKLRQHDASPTMGAEAIAPPMAQPSKRGAANERLTKDPPFKSETDSICQRKLTKLKNSIISSKFLCFVAIMH